MKLAKVIGTVVATKKIESINNLKILMIQPVDDKLQPAGSAVAAIDTVQAGIGELVYYTQAREAAFALPNPNAAIDAAITGIVDQVNIESTHIHQPQKIFEKGA